MVDEKRIKGPFRFVGSDSVNDAADGESATPRWEKEDIRELCQFLEHEVVGEEGDEWIRGSDYEGKLKMRGMFITFRHGERSSIGDVDDKTGCLASRDADRIAFQNYKRLIDSDDFQVTVNIDAKAKQWRKYPFDAECSAGNLTAEGALQHVRLGKFLRKKYSASSLLLEENQRIVAEITTSNYFRTFQSALAFASEFFYKQKEIFAPIPIRVSNYSFQCLDAFCDCPIGKKMRLQYEKEHLEEFLSRASPEIKRRVDEILANHEKYKFAKDPFQLIDISLGHYICRRKTLPCFEEKCITYEFLNQIVNISTIRGARMFDETIGIARRLQILESYPILTYLTMAIERIRKFPHTNYIRVFSAHDAVVGPILRTLGIRFIDPPHYTARVVFEIYEHSDEGVFIRVLYNGKNRSDEVRFCKNDDLKFGMCRASAFERFVESGIFELAKCIALIVVVILVPIILIAILAREVPKDDGTRREFVLDQCQFYEKPLSGDEGAKKNLTLRGVFMIFRHGKKILPVKNLECNSLRNKREVREFEKFKKLRNDFETSGIFQIGAELEKWKNEREKSNCTQGFLAKEGVIQHLKLGRFMAKAYSNFFESAKSPKISARTSNLERTFTSAEAFLAGLLENRQLNASIDIKASNDSNLCADEFCRCRNFTEIMHKPFREMYEMFERKPVERLKSAISALELSHPEIGRVGTPFNYIDKAISGFVCHPQCDLPICRDYSTLYEMYEYVAELWKSNIKNDEGITRRFIAMAAYPFFTYVLDGMQNLGDERVFKIFSNHDIFIGAQLFLLGIEHNEPVPYTSRLVFEAFEHPSGSMFRVLFNGKDFTNKIGFCKVLIDGLCKVDDFRDYMNREFFAFAGFKTMSDVCNLRK
ncbi:unnamed protein product [Caenorhabditis bovis]|uniref:Histidine acid phosphatase n=1 Tax=Caenorhabditis bovis TaxID=2654633 RepID=A0A8S1EXI8_9PELO|nr:unnamed protein product [Caenorhabditis bovis]